MSAQWYSVGITGLYGHVLAQCTCIIILVSKIWKDNYVPCVYGAGALSPDQGLGSSSPPLERGMDAESARGGSSSTMSVGSETSPVCTVERTTLRESRRLLRRTFDRQVRTLTSVYIMHVMLSCQVLFVAKF